MTATARVQDYAIGPSLFDATREKWEQQERMRESQDAAFEDHFSLWRRFSYIDQEKKKAREEIAEVMSAAMSDLYGNTKDSEAFDQALFTWFCSKDNGEATNALHELLDKHVRAAVRKEWERERRIAA